MFSDRSKYPEPSIIANTLFILLFSGPPKLRLRSPDASLNGAIDWVVILHTIVWIIAGIWTVSKMRTINHGIRFSGIRLNKLSLLLVGCLAISIFHSDAPPLTAFKVYQLLITILFTFAYVRQYGTQRAFRALLLASTILCAADVIALLLAPEMVFSLSEFGAPRFTGELIGPTGVLGVFGLILLLTSETRRSQTTTLAGIVLFGLVTLFSLMRTAYLAVFAFLLFALWKGPEFPFLKRFVRWSLVVLPVAALGGALAQLDEYRAAETVWTLSDRLGLWAYLIGTMWNRSRWFGLGYFAASRIYGPEYNAELGNAHSVFVEVLSGGGIVSFTVFLILWVVLLYCVVQKLHGSMTSELFTATALLPIVFFFVFIGSELEADPAGFTLWLLIACFPLLHAQRSHANPKTLRRLSSGLDGGTPKAFGPA